MRHPCRSAPPRRCRWSRRVAVAIAVGCSGGGRSSSRPPPSADPAKDKLAQVLARGTLVLWTDLEYPPQSFAVDGATRAGRARSAPRTS